jgi:hypothetical protein
MNGKFLPAALLATGLACSAALYAERQALAPLAPALQPETDVQEASQMPVPLVLGPAQPDGSRSITPRKDAVGKRVRVEGLAWGQPFGLKGQDGTISSHVLPQVVHQGGSVFVKGIDFTATKALGKPVRVTGTSAGRRPPARGSVTCWATTT